MRSPLALYSLLIYQALFAAPAYAINWNFWAKPKVTTLRMELRDYTGRNADGLAGVDLVIDFAEQGDRVWIESQLYPTLHGKEVFNGRLRKVALDEDNFEKILKTLDPRVRARVDFFPAYLHKRSYASRLTGGKSVSLQTQSFFMDDSNTTVVGFSSPRGVTVLDLAKVYDRPVEIEVHGATRYGPSESGPKAHPEFRRQYTSATVRNVRPDWLGGSGSLGDRYMAKAEASERAATLYHDAFLRELMRRRMDSVYSALAALIERQDEAPNERDQENFKIFDTFLIGLKSRIPSYIPEPNPTKARTVRDALGARMVAFGSEPQDTWVMRFDPSSQRVEDDFLPLHGPEAWHGYSQFGEGPGAFVRFKEGVIVSRGYSASVFVRQKGPELVELQWRYPVFGVSASDETASMKVLASEENFEKARIQQLASGAQGHSEEYKNLMEVFLLSRGQSAHCTRLLLK